MTGIAPRRDLPQSSVGGPCPVVLASQQATLGAYFLQGAPVDGPAPGDLSEPSFLSWRLRLGGRPRPSARMVSENGSVEAAALVRFELVTAVMFGPPNDEAFSGHPLADRGQRPALGADPVLLSVAVNLALILAIAGFGRSSGDGQLTFAQAITSTNPTAPIINSSVDRI